MTYKQDANNFVLKHGLDKSERIADVNYPFYSDITSSYYATDKNESISIKHLKRSIVEYRKIAHIEKILKRKINEFKGG